MGFFMLVVFGFVDGMGWGEGRGLRGQKKFTRICETGEKYDKIRVVRHMGWRGMRKTFADPAGIRQAKTRKGAPT